MSSSSDPSRQHRAPRKGGRVLTGRRIHVDATRRVEIDVHHLGRALIRLAQEHYDASGTAQGGPAPERSAEAPVRAHAPHLGSNGGRSGTRRTAWPAAPPRHQGGEAE